MNITVGLLQGLPPLDEAQCEENSEGRLRYSVCWRNLRSCDPEETEYGREGFARVLGTAQSIEKTRER